MAIALYVYNTTASMAGVYAAQAGEVRTAGIAAAPVVLAATGDGNTLAQPAGPTSAAGVATGTLSSTAAATKTVSATIAGVNITQTATITVSPAAASQLAFTGQPNGATAGVAITPAVQVTVRDGFGNTATAFTGNVTVAILTNPAGGTLSGTATRAAIAGVATFGEEAQSARPGTCRARAALIAGNEKSKSQVAMITAAPFPISSWAFVAAVGLP